MADVTPGADAAGAAAAPLWKKLGLRPGMRVQVLHADDGWRIPLEGGPEVDWVDAGAADLLLAFHRSAAGLLAELDGLAARIRPAGMLWAAWPRRAGGHSSDLSDRLVRQAALDRGLVDVKVAALDADWSALKLVWRLANR